MKYRLLIVDDEKWIREGLKQVIPWSSLGIEVIGEAWNGEEALELISQFDCPPDIIIADVSMPHMDGIELAEKVKDLYPCTKVIIISGYDNFEYAQKAIKFEVVDYILKPVHEKALISTVQKCINSFNAKEKTLAFDKALTDEIERNRPALREHFYLRMFAGEYIEEKELLEKRQFLDLIIDENRYYSVLCLSIQFIGELDSFEKSCIKQDIYDQSEKIMSGTDYHVVRGLSYDLYLVVSCYQDQIAEKKGQLTFHMENFMNLVEDQYPVKLSCGLGSFQKRCDMLFASYKQALEALGYRLYYGNTKVIEYEKISVRRGYDFLYDIQMETEIANLIRLGKTEEIMNIMDEFFEKIASEDKKIKSWELALIIFNILNSCARVVYKINPIKKIFFPPTEGTIYCPEFSSIEEAQKHVGNCISHFAQYVDASAASGKTVMKKALEYINHNYPKDISLRDISEHVNFNTTYFCELFKNEMGISFSKYLMRLRIDKAKELLADTNYKVYEIGEKIGYPDAKYFSKVFKMVEGITPNDFREKIAAS